MSKYRIYIDEVGNADLESSKNINHRYLSLTGIIFDLDFVKDHLFHDVEALKRKYFGSHPDDPVILYRKEILNKNILLKVCESLKWKKHLIMKF